MNAIIFIYAVFINAKKQKKKKEDSGNLIRLK